jgi:hypothetical protein
MSPIVVLCEYAVRLAALLVPRELRADWVDSWISEIRHAHALLAKREDSRRDAWRRLLRFTGGAFRDAADLNRSRAEPQPILDRPTACLTACLALLVALVAGTHGLRNCRYALQELPFPQAGHLSLLSRSGRVLGIQATPNVADLAACRKERPELKIAGFVIDGEILRVTPEFYSVAGSVPHLPFRFLGRQIQSIRTFAPRSGTIGVLARWSTSARRAAFPGSSGAVLAVRPIESRIREPLFFAAAVWLLSLIAGTALARRGLRSTLFFAAKTALVECGIVAAWGEFVAAQPIPWSGGDTWAIAFLSPGLLLIVAASALWWSVQDQYVRCPVCCRLLAMPVRIGSRSSMILDRPGVEVLCPSGHGSLLIHEALADAAEPALWTAFHESWRDCFVPGGSR